MNITVHPGDAQRRAGEALIVNLFEGVRPGGATGVVDQALGGLISAAIDSGDFTGKPREILLLYTGGRLPTRRVLVVGLGKPQDLRLEGVRQAAGVAAHKLQSLGVHEASTILHGAGAGGLDVAEAAQALAEGSALGCYRFEHYRTEKSGKELRRLAVVERDRARLAAARRGVRDGMIIAAATAMARDLINHPGNTATPAYLASCARRLARTHGLRCRVLDEPAMRRLGMGGLLAVTRGSGEGARFIVLEHATAGRGRRDRPPLVFVGKGVTFDSGGISLKDPDGMENMKGDMSGGAAVLGALQAVAALRLAQPVVGLIPATENLPDGKAYRPGDVLTTMAGRTIEIISTDAEGRLILADALTYAAPGTGRPRSSTWPPSPGPAWSPWATTPAA
ncbi:MAG: M17 family peptidase N-terminal domain-containing protein [Gemmatimonadota bacterium]